MIFLLRNFAANYMCKEHDFFNWIKIFTTSNPKMFWLLFQWKMHNMSTRTSMNIIVGNIFLMWPSWLKLIKYSIAIMFSEFIWQHCNLQSSTIKFAFAHSQKYEMRRLKCEIRMFVGTFHEQCSSCSQNSANEN